jgi:hypothetical protein
MTSLHNFRVDVSTKGWCCIFDVQLALSRIGLALALRLSEQMECWQVRGFWQMLDDSDYYLSHEKMLQQGGANELPIFAQGVTKLNQSREILYEWQTARFQSDLMSKLCWLGYAVEESMLPQDIDSQLDHRFDILAQTLEERWTRSNTPTQLSQVQYECSRDAVALTAALSLYKPFILTLCQADSDISKDVREPQLCEYIRHCGIECVKAEHSEKISTMASYLIQTLTSTGALELIYASGLNLAVVHIVSPKAYVMSVQQHSEEQLDPKVIPFKTTKSQSENFQNWNGCTAFWYPLWP